MIPRVVSKPTRSTSFKSFLYWSSWLESSRTSLLGCGVVHRLMSGQRARTIQRCLIDAKKTLWDRFRSLVVELSPRTRQNNRIKPRLLLPPQLLLTREDLSALLNNLYHRRPATYIQMISFFWNRRGQRRRVARSLKSSEKLTNEQASCSGRKHGAWQTTFQSSSASKNWPIPPQRSFVALWGPPRRAGFVSNFGCSRRSSDPSMSSVHQTFGRLFGIPFVVSLSFFPFVGSRLIQHRRSHPALAYWNRSRRCQSL